MGSLDAFKNRIFIVGLVGYARWEERNIVDRRRFNTIRLTHNLEYVAFVDLYPSKCDAGRRMAV